MVTLRGRRRSPAVGFLFSLLLLLCLLSLAAILAHLAGLPDPVSLPGRFLFQSFSWAAFFIPLYFLLAALLLTARVFRVRLALMLTLSVVPFLTASLLLHVVTGSSLALPQMLLAAFGEVPSALLLFLLLMLEILFLATLPFGMTTALQAGRAAIPSAQKQLQLPPPVADPPERVPDIWEAMEPVIEVVARGESSSFVREEILNPGEIPAEDAAEPDAARSVQAQKDAREQPREPERPRARTAEPPPASEVQRPHAGAAETPPAPRPEDRGAYQAGEPISGGLEQKADRRLGRPGEARPQRPPAHEREERAAVLTDEPISGGLEQKTDRRLGKPEEARPERRPLRATKRQQKRAAHPAEEPVSGGLEHKADRRLGKPAEPEAGKPLAPEQKKPAPRAPEKPAARAPEKPAPRAPEKPAPRAPEKPAAPEQPPAARALEEPAARAPEKPAAPEPAKPSSVETEKPAAPEPAKPAPPQPELPFEPGARRAYAVPVEGVLKHREGDAYWVVDEETRRAARVLTGALQEFNIEAEVTGIRKGPVITLFEVLPAPGVRVSKIANLADNIALRLAAPSVRIVAPIPGKHAVGIEVPNRTRAIVSFKEMISLEGMQKSGYEIPVALGKDILGEAQVIDLVQTPHLLIGGATNSGKSVLVNAIICSILFRKSPEEVRMFLIDPKIVELKSYNGVPHLLTPVITEPRKAFQALQYCISEMERRYTLLDALAVRDIRGYNKKARREHVQRLPYIVIVIDEFADLMATTGKELESTLARLAAMARAVGIHMVLATQRPSIDVITGLIKANIPSRIAFMVANKFDSRIIIDSVGAEKLLGKGDMLFSAAWNPFPTRIQGAYVDDEETEAITGHLKKLGPPQYIEDEVFFNDEEEGGDFEGEPGNDPLFERALEIVVSQGKASASYLQRRLKVGYNRAARLVEEMEMRGIVGPAQGSKPREILHVPKGGV